MPRLDLTPLPLPGLVRIARQQARDSRGFFSRFFCAQVLQAVGITRPIAQINHTYTARSGAVRGLHFQHPPDAEDKIISCLRGTIFDVAVDLRRGSPTFLQWHAEILSSENAHSLLVPQGFAHGFQTLSDDCELLYLHTHPHTPQAEGAMNVSDPRLAIRWPAPFTDISERDTLHPHLTSDFQGI
jgi:dTDP-4-dehydrorhamnose 3,5-epimerase